MAVFRDGFSGAPERGRRHILAFAVLLMLANQNRGETQILNGRNIPEHYAILAQALLEHRGALSCPVCLDL